MVGILELLKRLDRWRGRMNTDLMLSMHYLIASIEVEGSYNTKSPKYEKYPPNNYQYHTDNLR